MKRVELCFAVWMLPLLVALLATGCASTEQLMPMPDQTKVVANLAKSRIYVVRPSSFGGGIPIRVSDNDEYIGHTGPKGYLCWERLPGRATIRSRAEDTSLLTLDCRRGEAYYILQRVQMGLLFARNELEMLSSEEGRRLISKCKPARMQ